MSFRLRMCAAGVAALSVLVACGGAGSTFSTVSAPSESPSQSPTKTPNTAPTCPPPSPGPTPIAAWLAYPPNGTADVPVTIGEIIEKGATAPGEGESITVSSSSGNVPLGTPTPAPSPYPTPFATTPPAYGLSNLPYMSIPLPTLSPATTYTVSDVYTGWADNPPQCSAQYTQFAGTFTTAQ